MAFVGSSHIEISSEACTTRMPVMSMLFSFAAAAIFASSPTAVMFTPYSRTACAAPLRISAGALSPPIASMMMFISLPPIE